MSILAIKPRVTLSDFKKMNDSAQAESRRVMDAFSNQSARLGFGTSNLLEGTSYPLTRLTRNYILMISLYRSNWIVRKVIDAKAEDMLKNGWEITTQNSPDEIDGFNKAVDNTGTIPKLIETVQWARLYGGAAALIILEGDNDLAKPLTVEDVEPDTYKGLLVFDRWAGISPNSKLCTDFNDPINFGEPESYTISLDSGKGIEVHTSRLLKFTGRRLPRWEKQAEQYWGISEVEIMYEELRKRDNTSWNIASLIFRANIMGLKQKDLAQMLSGVSSNASVAAKFYATIQAQNDLMTNQGMFVLPEEGGLETHQYSFGGISDVYEQFMMDVCGATEYTMTRLFGRTITGLGQNNEGDEHQYYDHIAQLQKQQLDPQLKKLLPIVAMSTWGDIPDDFGWKFNPVRSLTDKDQAELAKSNTDSVVAVFNGGIIGRKTALQELQQQADVTGLFSNITDEQVEEAEEEPMQMGEEEGGEPQSGTEALLGTGEAEDAAWAFDAEAEDMDHDQHAEERQSASEALSRILERYRKLAAAAGPDALRASGLDAEAEDISKFEESKHSRAGKGSAGKYKGGQFTPKGQGGGGKSASKKEGKTYNQQSGMRHADKNKSQAHGAAANLRQRLEGL